MLINGKEYFNTNELVSKMRMFDIYEYSEYESRPSKVIVTLGGLLFRRM